MERKGYSFVSLQQLPRVVVALNIVCLFVVVVGGGGGGGGVVVCV